jgi:transposase-like protein
MSAFAEREGLDAQRLSRWRRRLASRSAGRRVTPKPAFIELVPRAAEPVEVVLRSGRILRVSTAIDPAALQRLVAALEQAEPC